jgi:hypothetical protein
MRTKHLSLELVNSLATQKTVEARYISQTKNDYECIVRYDIREDLLMQK